MSIAFNWKSSEVRSRSTVEVSCCAGKSLVYRTPGTYTEQELVGQKPQYPGEHPAYAFKLDYPEGGLLIPRKGT